MSKNKKYTVLLIIFFLVLLFSMRYISNKYSTTVEKINIVFEDAPEPEEMYITKNSDIKRYMAFLEDFKLIPDKKIYECTPSLYIFILDKNKDKTSMEFDFIEEKIYCRIEKTYYYVENISVSEFLEFTNSFNQN